MWNAREQRAVPIAVLAPPPPPEVIETNRYVPYETNHYRTAHAWAAEQVARKFPHAVEMLQTLDSLIAQQMNAGEQSDER